MTARSKQAGPRGILKTAEKFLYKTCTLFSVSCPDHAKDLSLNQKHLEQGKEGDPSRDGWNHCVNQMRW